MKIPPDYQITPEILELISQIEAIRIFLKSFPIRIEVREKIQRVGLLKSSLFSAKIEGNPLTIEEIETREEDYQKMEVFNILRAIKYVEKKISAGRLLAAKDILEIHRIVMQNLTPDIGCFRREMGAIFNSAGVAVYLSPPPSEIKPLINKLLDYINSDQEKFPLVTAFITHLVLEKIHPFIDGNGRVGRLFILSTLKVKSWNFPISVSLEEYLDEHKDEYYFHLDRGLQETGEYLLFMLTAYYRQAEKLKDQLIQEQNKKEEVFLPPRQEEIYYLVREQRLVSFDMIRRRFLSVPERTLRYDLKKLMDKNLITKTGKTKGCYYLVQNSSS